ncbi:hypothetical protein BDF20DRAFT_866946 [Mycotypha africana]|uniref:uncharacterized protein n=1 Tax=Mycotypha africana TaxID=64632 RepID=UPI0023019415|nr:uncharacterized protein BDF20DRAFT_866946 [Mycotypha africana]KAI8982441.1 hypothetical protein BDF20DRAFT_866946 [Mycotypha africana]
MVEKLPIDLQLEICSYAIGQFGNEPFVFTAMTVNKNWAYFACQVLYRNYRIENYLKFSSFVKTITSPNALLPYGYFVRSIDLTPINKYGIDMKASRLLRCCPNIVEMRLGHPTTLRPETIQNIAEYNDKLHTIYMGGIESFPFMLECDFSRLRRLRHVTLETTPLLTESLMSLPSESLLSLCLIKMDAITPNELYQFYKLHPNLQSLTLINCRALMTPDLGEILSKMLLVDNNMGGKLALLHLEGLQITDKVLLDLFRTTTSGAHLKEVRLCNTSVTEGCIDAITNQQTLPVSMSDKLTLSDFEITKLVLMQKRQS